MRPDSGANVRFHLACAWVRKHVLLEARQRCQDFPPLDGPELYEQDELPRARRCIAAEQGLKPRKASYNDASWISSIARVRHYLGATSTLTSAVIAEPLLFLPSTANSTSRPFGSRIGPADTEPDWIGASRGL